MLKKEPSDKTPPFGYMDPFVAGLPSNQSPHGKGKRNGKPDKTQI